MHLRNGYNSFCTPKKHSYIYHPQIHEDKGYKHTLDFDAELLAFNANTGDYNKGRMTLNIGAQQDRYNFALTLLHNA